MKKIFEEQKRKFDQLLDDDLREAAPLTVVDKSTPDDHRFDAEAIAEANATLPGPDITDLAPAPKPRRRVWSVVLGGACAAIGLWLLFAMHAPVGTALLPIPSFQLSNPACVFSDGTIRSGRCMFEEQWNNLDSTKWNAPPRFWEGPTQQVANGGQCFEPSEVTASSHVLHLKMEAHASTCPSTWDCSGSYYTTNFGTNWPCPLPGQASTSYDMGLVQTRLFQYKYGTIEFTAKMPGGTGPGAEVGLWGSACMSNRGVIPEGNETFFAHNGTYPSGCLFPVSSEMDLVNFYHGSGNINSTVYVDNSVGSPTLIGSFGGSNYYGTQWSNQMIGGATKLFLNGNNPPADPTAAFHTYKVRWNPFFWAFYIDGKQQTFEQPSTRPTWITSQTSFLVLWIADSAAVNPATLPQEFQIGPVYVYCEDGDPCTCSGGAAGGLCP